MSASRASRRLDIILPGVEIVRRRAYEVTDCLGEILANQAAGALGKTPEQLEEDDVAITLLRTDGEAQSAFVTMGCAQLIALETLAAMCRRHLLGVFVENQVDHPLWDLVERERDALIAWHEERFADEVDDEETDD